MPDNRNMCSTAKEHGFKNVATNGGKSGPGITSADADAKSNINDNTATSEKADAEPVRRSKKQMKATEESDSDTVVGCDASPKLMLNGKVVSTLATKKGVAYKVVKPKHRNDDLVPQARTNKPALGRGKRVEERNNRMKALEDWLKQQRKEEESEEDDGFDVKQGP